MKQKLDKDKTILYVKYVFLLLYTGLARKYQWWEFPVVITGKYSKF
jgi:hypothetical protein